MVSLLNVHRISFDMRDLADCWRPRNHGPGGGSPDWTRTCRLTAGRSASNGVPSAELTDLRCAWSRIARLPVAR
jgi:hypothetical protein